MNDSRIAPFISAECIAYVEQRQSLSKAQFKKCIFYHKGDLPITAVGFVRLPIFNEGEEATLIGYAAQGTAVVLLNVLSGEVFGILSDSPVPITAVVARDDGKLIAFANEAGDIYVASIETRRTVRHYSTGIKTTALSFSRDNLFVMSSHADTSLRLFELAINDTPIKTVDVGGENLMRSICPTDTGFLAVSSSGDLYEYDKSCQIIREHALNSDVSNMRIFDKSLYISVKNNVMVLNDNDFSVQQERTHHLSPVNDLHVSKGGLITCSEDNSVKLTSLEESFILYERLDAAETPTACNYADGYFIYGTVNGQVKVVRRITAEEAITTAKKARKVHDGVDYFLRGRHADVDSTVEITADRHRYDATSGLSTVIPHKVLRRLRNKQYTRALFAALHQSKPVFWLCVEEMSASGVLDKAVNGLSNDQFNTLVTYIVKFQNDPIRFAFQSSQYILIEAVIRLNREWLSNIQDEETLLSICDLKDHLAMNASRLRHTKPLISIVKSSL